MIEQQFAQQDTIINRLDLRIKIIVVIIFAIIVAVSKQLFVLSQLLVVACCLLYLCNVSFDKLLSRLAIINIFILFIWLIMPISVQGEVVLNWGLVTIYKAGLNYAWQITLRANAIMILIISLLSSAKVTALIKALEQLHLPKKLIYLLFLTFRYLHVLKLEYKKIWSAMLSRGFKKRKSSWQNYKFYAYLIAMVLIKSYERSQKVYQAMLCKNFKGQFYFASDFKLAKVDVVFLVSGVIFASWLICLERGWINL